MCDTFNLCVCNNVRRQITGIGLEQYWSNIKCPSNNGQSSWKNAWKKAGVCSGLDEKAYFEKALSFRSRINPLVRLKKNGKLNMHRSS
jgi:ribonuclease T2